MILGGYVVQTDWTHALVDKALHNKRLGEIRNGIETIMAFHLLENIPSLLILL